MYKNVIVDKKYTVKLCGMMNHQIIKLFLIMQLTKERDDAILNVANRKCFGKKIWRKRYEKESN